MSSDDVLGIVNRFNDAWGAHDLEACLAMLADDCLFASTGPAPDGEDVRGKDAIRAAWAPIFANTASVFTTEEQFAAGDRVVQRWHYDWGDGHVRGVDLFRVRDGLIAEKLSYVKG